LQLHAEFVAIHFPFQCKLISCGTVEREFCPPRLAVAFHQQERVVVNVDGHAKPRERVIGTLNCHRGRRIKDHATPLPIIVIQHGRSHFAIDRKLVHVPYTVKRGSRAAFPRDRPIVPICITLHRDEIQSKHNLDDARDSIRPARSKQLRLDRPIDGTISKKQIGEPLQIRRNQKQTQQDQMERDLFQADIVSHVQHEDLRHVHEADQRA
jgi:hypothetical protein